MDEKVRRALEHCPECCGCVPSKEYCEELALVAATIEGLETERALAFKRGVDRGEAIYEEARAERDHYRYLVTELVRGFGLYFPCSSACEYSHWGTSHLGDARPLLQAIDEARTTLKREEEEEADPWTI